MKRTHCTFGVRSPMDTNMMNERIIKEYSIVPYDAPYRPNFNKNPLTGKFYSKHDCIITDKSQSQKYYEKLELARSKGPKDKFTYPKTENQKYGWYKENFIEAQLRKHNVFHHPIISQERRRIQQISRKAS